MQPNTGLVAYVHSRDPRRIYRPSRALQFGLVAVNSTKVTGAPIPFGGMNQSGLGRGGSRHGMERLPKSNMPAATGGGPQAGMRMLTNDELSGWDRESLVHPSTNLANPLAERARSASSRALRASTSSTATEIVCLTDLPAFTV